MFFRVLFLILFPALTLATPQDFPVSDYLRPKVDFWKKVYTEIGSSEAFLHDAEETYLIYKKINYKGKQGRSKNRYIRQKISEVKKVFDSLIKKKLKATTKSEKELLALFEKPTISLLKAKRRRIISQQGLRDMYLAGLKRSGRYYSKIKDMFKEMQIPEELAWLPHVESSFNYLAYSKVGAAGIWQFMRATAKQYNLKMNYVVDERRDPLVAGEAAGKLLKSNYEILKSWPLAITAYNFGRKSLLNAIKRHGTRDISEIIKKYKSRRFQFASRSFYPTFMATLEISQDPKQYFSRYQMDPELEFFSFKLPNPISANEIMKMTSLNKKELLRYNPSLRPGAFKSAFLLPKDFLIRLPRGLVEKSNNILAQISSYKPPFMDPNVIRTHKVRRGETLYDISRAYNTSLGRLISFNRIDNPNRILPGTKILIPGRQVKRNSQAIITADPKPVVAAVKKKEIIKEFNKGHYNLDLKPLGKNLYQATVEIDETFGHFSDWSRTKMRELRKLNNWSRRRVFYLGQKIKLRMSEEQKDIFEEERIEYHLSIEEDFFENYKIVSTKSHRVKKGESLLSLSRSLDIPAWLLNQYIKRDKLTPGKSLLIPVIVPRIQKSF